MVSVRLVTMQHTLLLLLLTGAWLISHADARGEFKNKKDFAKCGGSKACLGPQKLEKIRRKSGMHHKSVDELAQQIDLDEDLVRIITYNESF